MYSFLAFIAFAISLVVCTPVRDTNESATTGVITAQFGSTTEKTFHTIEYNTTETPQTDSVRTKASEAVVMLSTTGPRITKNDLDEALKLAKSMGFRDAIIHGFHIDGDYVHITPRTTAEPDVTTTRPQLVTNVSSGVGHAPFPSVVAILVLFYYIM